jgi:predicted DNA-binding protein
MTRPSRINARLPPDVARKVTYLERHTNQTTTQVLRESIEHYYTAVTEGKGTAAEALERSGFVGCASGPVDLSSSYKAELARSTSEKT